MEVKFGERCPMYGHEVLNKEYSTCHCCNGKTMSLDDMVICKYEQVPSKLPKFSVGSIVYSEIDYGEKLVVKDIKWTGLEYLYKVGRKQILRDENLLHDTFEECDFMCSLRKVKKGISFIKDMVERYGKERIIETLKGEYPELGNNLRLLE